MSRLRVLVAILALVCGVALIALGRLAPGPPRVNIRWTSQTTDQQRTEAEQSLHLAGAIPRDGHTWSYLLLDTSRDNVGRVLDHPAVEDRHYFGLGRTLTPEGPPLQAWLQARYGRPPANWIASGWWAAGPVLVALAALIAWPQLVAVAATTDVRLVALLVVSALVRLSLIVSGGQYYWPDEGRYRRAQELVTAIVAHDSDRMRVVLQEPTSLLLKLVGVLPAAIEHAIGNNPHIPAVVFGGCSVVSIWLVAAIARRLEASREQAFLAAFLAAASTALLYFSRHLLPYDLALMLGLVGVYAGVNRNGSRRASLATGLWVIVAFLAYAGAWPLTVAAGAVHLADSRSWRDAIRRATWLAVAPAAVIAALVVGFRAAGLSWIKLTLGFAGGVRQGEFAEGWRLPFDYLWNAEHGLLIAWLIAVAWCIGRLRWTLTTRLTRAALVGVVTIYGALAVPSTLLERFVVYGRLTRPLIPFLCLLAAAAIESAMRQLTPRTRAMVSATVVLAVGVQAAFNFRIPLRQEFPAEFIASVEQRFPPPRLFVNARHMYPGPEPTSVPAGYREVAAARHPLEFRPYQYEGYTPGERELLKGADLRMRAFIQGP